jgi:hypothetical protein
MARFEREAQVLVVFEPSEHRPRLRHRTGRDRDGTGGGLANTPRTVASCAAGSRRTKTR